MMLIHVKEIPITGRDYTGTIDVFDIDLPEYTFISPIEFQCNAQKSGQDVRIRGKVDTTIQFECQRCLEQFPFELHPKVELYYQPMPNYFHDNHDLNEKDLGTIYYKNNIINLTEALRDTILLDIPMKLVCKQDCKGLCQYCGMNLNVSTCNCNQQQVAKNNPFQQILNQMNKK
ncbi:MAG TPA: DUF177 domain-containing protein [Planctomycetota bacterium]|nr:DUF177 domain-containing protein [Planctomycetota bacterium]